MQINYEAEQAMPVEKLREIFIFNPETGLLLHRRQRGYGPSFVYAIQPAGTINSKGYLVVTVGDRRVLAHRACWAIHNGEWPNLFLDHINGLKTDNRISNLRLATKAENGQNAKVRVDSVSGVRGVGWQSDRKQWRARIKVEGRVINLGRYTHLEDAAMVRRIAEHTYWRGVHTFPQEAETGINCANGVIDNADAA